jgi:hypothetical protein
MPGYPFRKRDVAQARTDGGARGMLGLGLCMAGSLLWRAGDGVDRASRDVEAFGELLVAAGHGLYGVAGRVIDR